MFVLVEEVEIAHHMNDRKNFYLIMELIALNKMSGGSGYGGCRFQGNHLNISILILIRIL